MDEQKQCVFQNCHPSLFGNIFNHPDFYAQNIFGYSQKLEKYCRFFTGFYDRIIKVNKISGFYPKQSPNLKPEIGALSSLFIIFPHPIMPANLRNHELFSNRIEAHFFIKSSRNYACVTPK